VQVKISDIELLRKLILNIPVEQNSAGADINNDGIVNVFDLISAKQMYSN